MKTHHAILFSSILFATVWCQKTQMTRTALHVARSLDPDSMESMSVKTKTGDVATIIVKKRNGEVNNNLTNHKNVTTAQNDTSDSLFNATEGILAANKLEKDRIEKTSSANISTELPHNVTKQETQNTSRTDRGDGRSLVPNPVFISSSPIFVKGTQQIKKSRSIMKIDNDGIPIITGIRMPDDESDNQIWRNARVINGMLVPYDKSEPLVHKLKPFHKPTTMSSPSFSPTGTFLKETPDKSWLKIGTVTKMPPKLPIRTHPVKDNVWTDRVNPWAPPSSPFSVGSYVPSSTEEIILETIDNPQHIPFMGGGNLYKQHPLGLWLPKETSVNSEETYVSDKILDYIKNVNKDEMKRLSSHRFDNSRGARMAEDPYQIQSRILQMPGASNFPNSQLYSESSVPPSRVSFEEGVRTPVLQYAHPEYGVQTAKIPSTTQPSLQNPGETYVDENMHSDRGPFSYEPSMSRDTQNQSGNNQRSNGGATANHKPRKTSSLYYPEMPSSFKYYGKYPSNDNSYNAKESYPLIYYNDNDGRPFWNRIGDSLKESVQTSIGKVTDLTRPVVEPIIEATNTLSKNFGFPAVGNRDLSTIREKLGSVSTSSFILPAIGIVAGSAALGLGAVAVGRYLNYDVVKMRHGKSITEDDPILLLPESLNQLNLQNTWAIDSSRTPKESKIIQHSEQKVETEKKSTPSRRRRSIQDEYDVEMYLQNMLQILDGSEKQSDPPAATYPSEIWSDTPCSKKTFCDALSAQSDDAVLLMEKKIISFLTQLRQDVAMIVSPHLDEVMSNVRNKNCSVYQCMNLENHQNDNVRHNSRKFNENESQ